MLQKMQIIFFVSIVILSTLLSSVTSTTSTINPLSHDTFLSRFESFSSSIENDLLRERYAMNIMNALYEKENGQINEREMEKIFDEQEEKMKMEQKGFKEFKSSNEATQSCVGCYTIKNLMVLMCNQNYNYTANQFCVPCTYLAKIASLMCTLNCTSSSQQITYRNQQAIQTSCVHCESYYLSIELLCGAPSCTPATNTSSLLLASDYNQYNCVPCYNQWLAYQLVCHDLFNHCVPAQKNGSGDNGGGNYSSQQMTSTTQNIETKLEEKFPNLKTDSEYPIYYILHQMPDIPIDQGSDGSQWFWWKFW